MVDMMLLYRWMMELDGGFGGMLVWRFVCW